MRAARLTLEERRVPYTLEEVDVFGADWNNLAALKRQPFGKIPAFDHAGFALYETTAITRYVDEAFPGPALQPTDPKRRARMNQIIGILDSYLYRSLVWGVYMHKPEDGDEALAAALAASRLALGELLRIMGDADFLDGGALSLADLHAYPMFCYGVMKPEGQSMLADEFPMLRSWFEQMRLRPSAMSTMFPKEVAGAS